MSNAAKHRKKAAEFEQLKQIDRAIASYVKAIEESEAAGEEVDVALYNKVGDLALRQGRVPDALTYYERAVEHYATSGLFNNAIALCNKILRNAPGRANVYFTLGRISARKGLRGDATRNFLEYATRMQQDGRIEEGIRALAEVLELMPELNDVRTMVEDLATRSGIALPKRKTPLRTDRVPTPASSPAVREQKSPDLIYLDVDYSIPRRTPPRGGRTITPAAVDAVVQTVTRGAEARPTPTGRTLAPAPGLPLLDTSERVPPSPVGEDEVDRDPLGEALAEGDPAPLDGLEANGDFAAGADTPLLEGFTADEPLSTASGDDMAGDLPALAEAGGEPLDVAWIVPPGMETDIEVPQLDGVVSEDFLDATDDPGVARAIVTETPSYVPTVDEEATPTAVPALDEVEMLRERAVPSLEEPLEEPLKEPLKEPLAEPLALIELEDIAEQLPPERPPYRLDPHDFILPGELPPLRLEDAVVEAGLRRVLADAGDEAEAGTAPVSAPNESATVAPAEPAAPIDASLDEERTEAEASVATDADVDVDVDVDAVAVARGVGVTPSLPIAAVAEAAHTVASSRRDALRAAVARMPRNWLLRRRLAEALFEAGERDAALHELETAQQGLVTDGEFSAASDIADELVHVSPDRVGYHQKRVELAVRSHDQQRLRMAYLDLADALVRMGEEGRARAVYARVLEIDPSDDRARAALGAAAPPPPAPVARPDERFVDLADWLSDDDAPADTRMRMREPAISGDEQADFDALLRHFKEGVSRSLGEDDFESHYDLGVAYKEMGLLDDAIAEFQKALRSRAHRLPAYEALGQCFVEQGRFQVAATVLSRALHEPGLDDDQRVGVLYLLAYSCEALQRKDEARSYFQRVYATDINFRDVAARLAALEQAPR